MTFVGELEPFRDKTNNNVKGLRAESVSVDFQVYEGCYDTFDWLNPYADVSKKAMLFSWIPLEMQSNIISQIRRTNRYQLYSKYVVKQ